ncbi:phosphate ABC transporter permease PstA [uncultured Martelella sp.]|uniref:phosphate ABC transporter permease PstA n=1 Tax=uncultured Martelella sp. TaxID=392331 RepID=UPI0029C64D38|nr:phosphate ABC transporter permease PstA [uncultured Martelella sp.]
MTDTVRTATETAGGSRAIAARRRKSLKRRNAAERRFRVFGLLAICVGIFFLGALLFSVAGKGYTAFQQTTITLPVTFEASVIDPDGARDENPRLLLTADYPQLVRQALARTLAINPENGPEMRAAMRMISRSSRVELRDVVLKDPSVIGKTVDVRLLAAADIDSANKGQIDLSVPETSRRVSDRQLQWMEELKAEGRLNKSFNTGFFTHGASSRPEAAGIGVAFVGTLYMMGVVLLLALPIGVASAIYLEEFAPKNRFTDLIEVNINNLAAVPSIVFGLLGLAVFIGLLGLPRSASLVGGLVLTLMTLPTIIIATRAALKAVPPSIRSAALGVGASKMQAVFHHVLPLAMPGILTGTIIGLAQALGETAPLLLIGMVAFVADYPAGPLDPATALPVQIYMWAGEAERAFVERTSAAIIVLLAFLIFMNVTAVILRRRFERRW